MEKSLLLLFLLVPLFSYSTAFAVETAPRISDKEIIEGLSTIRGDIKEVRATISGDVNELRAEIKRLDDGQKSLEKRFDDMNCSVNKRFDDTDNSVNKRFDDTNNSVNKRFDDMSNSINKRFDDINNSVNRRFDALQWMLGLFITVAISLMGIMGRILWSQQKRLTQIETTLEAQKDEISFIKALIEKLQSLIEKLLPPKGVL